VINITMRIWERKYLTRRVDDQMGNEERNITKTTKSKELAHTFKGNLEC
jgi:hypothetical protein